MEHTFKWLSRYSETEEYDKHNRWARLCYYDDKLITWVNRHKDIDGETCVYSVADFYPTSGKDMPCLHILERNKTFEVIQKETEDRFKKFIDEIK